MIRSVAKEIFRLMQTIGTLSNGQAKILDITEGNTIIVAITPTDGFYKDGQFIFRIQIPDRYPLWSPDVTCLTPVYHPNIEGAFIFDESEADICINLLADWESTYDLEHVIQALLFLFYQPNLEDPINPMFEPGMDGAIFITNVRQSLEGGFVDGIEFPRNLMNTPGSTNEETMTTVTTGNIESDCHKPDVCHHKKQGRIT